MLPFLVSDYDDQFFPLIPHATDEEVMAALLSYDHRGSQNPIPNTPPGLKEREKAQWLFKVECIDVHPAENITFEVKESNHPVIATAFKPVVGSQFREALKRTLEEQINEIALKISNRSGVFGGTGLGHGAAMAAAVWSGVGGMRRMESGLLGGWKATGTGIIKEGLGYLRWRRAANCSKREEGFLGTNAVPLGERPKLQGIVEGGVSMTEGNKQGIREGAREVQSSRLFLCYLRGSVTPMYFTGSVSRKQRAYVRSDSWALSLPLAHKIRSVAGRYRVAQRSLRPFNMFMSVEFESKVLSKSRGILQQQCVRYNLPEPAVTSVVRSSHVTRRELEIYIATNVLKIFRLRTHSDRHRTQSASTVPYPQRTSLVVRFSVL
ncbi:hypothetical protein EDC04DRAFT_2906919 [Pisolithus marmoratus]|nr:hypothetical protein EDC04DRAFT_2906919 [Pisolithus marmoratus]